MSDKKNEIEIEIKSLNLDGLDVEELEHRLEMAMLEAAVAATCTVDSCYIDA